MRIYLLGIIDPFTVSSNIFDLQFSSILNVAERTANLRNEQTVSVKKEAELMKHNKVCTGIINLSFILSSMMWFHNRGSI